MRALSKRVAALFIVLLAGMLLSAPTVGAKAPPKAKYDCVIGSILFGTLTVKSGKHYAHRGTRGKFTAGKKRIPFPDKI